MNGYDLQLSTLGGGECRSFVLNERTPLLHSWRSERIVAGLVATRDDKRRLTRCRILRAALIEFARRGLDGAVVKTVSERAGVANGTVFWHFESKDRLYLESVASAVDEFYGELLPVVSERGVSFMQVIDNTISFLQAHPDIDVLLSSLRGEHPRPVVSEAARLVDARFVSIWRRWIVQSGTSGHRIPSASEDNLARLIAVTVSGIFATRFLKEDSDVRTVLADFGALIELSPAGKIRRCSRGGRGQRD